MKLTGVYDNRVSQKGLLPGWGFSLLVEGSQDNILFDTGADLNTLKNNMEKLDLDPVNLDGVVLSHPHCDHVGGLSYILKRNSSVKVFFTDSFPDSLKGKIESYGANPIPIKEPREIFEGIWTTGEMTTSYRGSILPEQGLIANTSSGPLLVSGCAHPGITVMVKKAREISGSSPYLVVGGLHLGSKQRGEVRKIIGELRNEPVKKLAPTHCTGEKAKDMIGKEYGKDCLEFGAGADISV